ncbi:hypothetical protein ACIA6T_32055 [Streptomyces sp. NPDC051740]|uniref:AraC-like ligand-binding domain-containing protein n=1 Tax=Streptomyces sp. NPDC051740 TaxID=3365673 RepID=UPI003796518B
MPSLRQMAGPVVTVDTDDIGVPDRFDWGHDMVDREVMPVSIRSPHAHRFQGRVESVGFPCSQVAAFGFSPMVAWCSPAHIRRQDPEDHFLVLVREGAARLEQERGVACLGPGGMALFSTSHPPACDFLDKSGPLRLPLLRLPRAVLPLPDGRADRMLAEPLPDGSGSGALLGPYLASLPAAARTSGPAELARLGTIGVDLAGSLLAVRGTATRTRCPPRPAERRSSPGSTPSSTTTSPTRFWTRRPSPPTTTSPYAPSTSSSGTSPSPSPPPFDTAAWSTATLI